MRLRYTLNNDTEGEYIAEYAPKGWKETELVLKRHEQYDGIFKDYTVKVEFFCGSGKEYIDNIYDTQGIEAIIEILIEIDCTDSGTFESLYEGIIMMDTYESVQGAPEYTRVNLKQAGIIETVLSRLETKVNLNSLESMDGTALSVLNFGPYEMTMHGKALSLIGEFSVVETSVTSAPLGNSSAVIMNIPMSPQLSEVDETFDVIGAFAQPSPAPLNYFYKCEEALDELNIAYRLKGSVIMTKVGIGARDINFFKIFRRNGGVDTLLFDSGAITGIPSNYTINFDISPASVDYGPISVGDEFYFYGSMDVDGGSWTCTLNMDDTDTFVTMTGTSLKEDTTANAWVVFEAGAQISRVITDQADSFRSNYFGRTNSGPKQYDANGCGSFEAITNGFQIRGFPLEDTTIAEKDISGKPVYMSMKEYFEGLNAIHCLGLGVKQEGENTYIEVEPKDYFYTEEVLFNLSNIKNLVSKVDKKFFYTNIKIGYSEWRKEGTNGLDEFCTTQEYSTLNKKVLGTLDARSSLIAAPYAIERQRRQRYVDTYTNDEEYDNNNFIICLNRSVNGSNIPTDLDTAEKDEHFINVTNVFSPETTYNLRLKPARNLTNWYKIISTSIIKLNDILKTVKFAFGEGNYKITSQGTEACDPAQNREVEAGQDVEILVPGLAAYDPLFTGDVDEFASQFSLSQYQELKELDEDGKPNFYKKIGYSTTTADFLQGYIIEFRYKPVFGMATFKMARAYERSESCSHIYVVEDYVECDYVE